MKKSLLLVSLNVFLINVYSFGQQVSYDNSVCWEITGPNASAPSYVLGSVHVFDTCEVKFPVKTIKKMIDKCGSFCSEINLTTKDNSTMKEFANRVVLLDNKKNITNSLDKVHYDKLIQIIDSSKTDLNLKMIKHLIANLQPSIIGIMVVAEKQLAGSSSFKSSNFNMDSYFEDYAVKNRFDTYELESKKEQMEMLLNYTFEESLEYLKNSIDEYYSNDTIDMIKGYINQNLQLLKPEEYTRPLMIKRNTKMANGIDAIIQKRPVFVIIGAAHLPYENGVLNLLVKKGYTVKPYIIKLN